MSASAMMPATTVRSRWDAALSRYIELRTFDRAAPDNSSWADRASEEETEALDTLIQMTDAPDLGALKVKLDLATERADGFTDILFADHARGIVADTYRLIERAIGSASPRWAAAEAALDAADAAMVALPSPMSDEDVDRCAAACGAAALAWAAIPAPGVQLALARMKRLSEDRPRVGSYMTLVDQHWPALIAEAAELAGAA